MAFTIKETIYSQPGWRANGTYQHHLDQRVWQIFEDGIWIADCETPTEAEIAVIDLEFAVEESAVLDLTDDTLR